MVGVQHGAIGHGRAAHHGKRLRLIDGGLIQRPGGLGDGSHGKTASHTKHGDPPDEIGYRVLDGSGAVRALRRGVVSEISRLEIMCPSVRPIERAMREPRMDPQSTVFPAQPCHP